MWLMAQADTPRTYMLATGRGRSVGDFVQATAEALDMSDWNEVVKVRPGLTRAEATPLIGDPGAAKTNLGWEHSIGFRDLVELMVQHELQGTMD